MDNFKSLKVTKHGRSMYVQQKCRCDVCKKANRDYMRKLTRRRKKGFHSPWVPAFRATQHLEKLSQAGLGTRKASQASGLSRHYLQDVKTGKVRKIRKHREDIILSITLENSSAPVDAVPTWALIGHMLGHGITKTEIAKRLGCKSGLQISKYKILPVTARSIERVYREIMF